MNRMALVLFVISLFLSSYYDTPLWGLWIAIVLFIFLIGLALWANMKGKTDTIDDLGSFRYDIKIKNDKIHDKLQYNELDDLFDEMPILHKKKTLKNILSDLYWSIYFPKWENK